MQIILSAVLETQEEQRRNVQRSTQMQTKPCRHPTYEVRPATLINSNRKIQQIVCPRCGFVAGTIDLHEEAEMTKMAAAIARLAKKRGA